MERYINITLAIGDALAKIPGPAPHFMDALESKIFLSEKATAKGA